jgi:hypothetical protein
MDRQASRRARLPLLLDRQSELDHWLAAATRLTNDGRLPPDPLELVRLAATFGELIANTDRHFGNLPRTGAYIYATVS